MAEFSIERLVFGDGSTDNSKRRLDENVYYGSTSRYGGYETFYEVELDSIFLFDCRLPPYIAEKLTVTAQTEETPETRIDYGCMLKEWLKEHKGVIADISGPGKRSNIRGISRMYVKDYGMVFMRCNAGLCALSAVANCFNQLVGREKALLVREKLRGGSVHVQTLRDITRIMRMVQADPTIAVKTSVQRIPKADMSEFKKDGFAYLCGLQQCAIVRLVERGKVDHVIVVDGRRKLIIDSAARYPLRLERKILKLCGGTSSAKLEVAEVRKIVLMNEASKRCHLQVEEDIIVIE